MVERDKLPSWWLEFLSICNKGTGPPSDANAQELARKQAVSFRLPPAQKERVGWWSAPLSLISLRCGDFLPSLTSRIQGSRDFQIVRRDQMVALVQALQLCTKLSGVPTGIISGAVWDICRCLKTPDREGQPVAFLTARGGCVAWGELGAPGGPSNLSTNPCLSWGGFWAWGSHQFGAGYHWYYQVSQSGWLLNHGQLPLQM